MIPVSYIILTRNRKEDLRENLNFLAKQQYEQVEIVVVDNASDDGTPRMIKTEFPQVVLVEMGYNSGVTKGRNAGIRRAEGEILIFVDDDAVLRDPQASKKIVRFFEDNSRLGALALREKNYYAPDEPIQWHFPGKSVADYAEKPFLTCYFPGAGHALRKEALEQTGLYPDYYFYSTEELDLSYRLLDAGFSISYAPEISVFHKISPKTRSDFRYYFDLRNHIWFAIRLLPWPRAVGHITYWLVKGVILGFPLNLGKVVAATFEAYRKRGPSLRDRKPLKKETLKLIKILSKKK